jgi:flagellar hook-basal body complex protein FliE
VSISPVTELTRPRVADATSDVIDAPTVAHATPDSVSFSDVLGDLVSSANRADAAASQKVEALANGLSDDLHGTMIAVKEADISVKLVASIRNKLLDAFNDLWKTSV